MNNTRLILSVFALLILISCSEEQNNVAPDEPIILKTLKIEDNKSGAFAIFEIISPEFEHYTSDNIKISALNDLSESEKVSPTLNSENLSNEEETLDTDSGNFIVSEINLPDGYNRLNIKVTSSSEEAVARGCKSPHTFQWYGHCINGQRIVGFSGHPENCSHTDWEWRRKQAWWWKIEYDEDSHSSSDDIGYFNSTEHSQYKLRIDPNSSCCFTPTSIHFTLTFENIDC